MGRQKYVECLKCGKLIPYEELAEHSKMHSEEQSSASESESPFNSQGITEEQIVRMGYRPLPKHRTSEFGALIVGVILISLGIAFLLGIGRYWPIIPIAIGLVYIARLFVKRW